MIKTILKFLVINLLVFSSYYAHGQVTQPEFNEAFIQNEVASVFIIIPQESLDLILSVDSIFSNYEHEATFIYQSSVLTDTIQNVGFRLRGNTSRLADKKSFKVSFNSFIPGNRWLGLKKLNLNGEHNDVSVMRSKLCWDMLREAGLAASRTSYVRLYINDEYKGLYLNVEHINDDFVANRFSEGDGNLYKCTWPAHLQYNGSNADDYNSSAYELQTNEWSANQYEDLAEFVTVLNQTNDENLFCSLPEVFNVRTYLKHMAAEVLLGHWDGHIYNKNNFYLYNNAAQGRMEWIPFDLDNTLGIDFLGTNWSNRNLYNWDSNEYRPLYERLLENEAWRNIYSYELNQLVQNHFNLELFQAKTTQWKELIAPHIEEDTYYSLDYGFTHNDFLESDLDSWGNHVDHGILEYVEIRAASALLQLEELNTLSGLHYLTDSSPVINESYISIQAHTDSNTEQELTLHYAFSDDDWSTAVMEWNGSHYSSELSLSENDMMLHYYVEYSDGTSTYNYPCTPRTIPVASDFSGVLINEIMADNEATILDNASDSEDWLELYNPSDATWLGNYFLSDELDFPNKWAIPGFTLSAADHVLFWCDDDPEEGPLHTNFKLKNSGDEAYLFYKVENGYQLKDVITFDFQEADISYGRNGDGSEDWTLFTTPTPDAPNLIVDISEENESSLLAYPNPTADVLYLENASPWVLLNGVGSTILTGKSSQIDLSHLPSGVYILSVSEIDVRVIKL